MPTCSGRNPFAVCVGLLSVLASISACSSSKQSPAPAPFSSSALWGDMKPVVSVKELMRDMLDPASDYIFDAVKVETTKSGTVEQLPKTDEAWEKIRFG